MRLKEIQQTYHQQLDSIYGENEVNSFFYMLIDHYFNISRLQLATNFDLKITYDDSLLLQNALEELKNEKPIQYIIGQTEFFGMPFLVNTNVLIPRPETEELVGWIVEEVSLRDFDKPLHLLDIGTGSGCIAISLAKNLPNAKVFAMDISKEALNVAQKNAEMNDVEVEFVHADILDRSSYKEFISPTQKFDIIVSNPPYVRQLEKSEMKNNVLQNEPHLALFVEDNDALLFYKKICEFSVDKLTTNGRLYFEINAYLGNEMKILLEHYFFKNIELKQDLFGKDRMVKAIK